MILIGANSIWFFFLFSATRDFSQQSPEKLWLEACKNGSRKKKNEWMADFWEKFGDIVTKQLLATWWNYSMYRTYPIGRGGIKFLPHGYKFLPARRSRKGKNFVPTG